ncbi:MAG: hypothetical protein QM776_02935 [Rhodocyclaceae bacterium]
MQNMPTLNVPRQDEALLVGIAQMEPARALGAVAELVTAVLGRREISEPERLRTLFAADQAVQRQARACIEHYLSAVNVGSAARHSLWRCAHDHWTLMFDAYGACLARAEAGPDPLDDGLMAELGVRAIRAGAQCVKWDAFRHGPVTDSLWGRLNRAYRLAAECRVTRNNVRLRTDRATETTVEREFLRVFALHSLGVDQLDPYRLELASRLIQYVLPWLELTVHPDAASLHWIDVATRNPPARLVRTPESAGLPRFFSGMVATQPLQEMLELVVAGDIPAPLLGIGEQDADESVAGKVASVLSHMVRSWSSEQPVRRNRRHGMLGTLYVVEGLMQFANRLAGEGVHGQTTWQMRDASVRGVGAEARLDDEDDLAVGMLVGMHLPDGNKWCVGAIRRLWRTSDHSGQVGVELLGGDPVVALAEDGSGESRVIVLDAVKRGHPVRLLVPTPGLRGGVPVYLLSGAAPLKLTPLSTLEYGTDHEIRMYLCG